MSEEALQANDTTQMNQDWRSHMPDPVKEWDEFKNADTQDKFWDQISNHRKMLGQSLRIPSEEAGTETMDQFYEKVQGKVPGLMRTPDTENADTMKDVWARLGKPEGPADYKGVEVEGYKPSDEAVQRLQEIAHEANLTQQQYRKLAAKVFEGEAGTSQSTQEAVQRDKDALAAEWGLASEQRTANARQIAAQTGAPESLMQIIDNGTVDSATMKWLYNLSQQMGGEQAPVGNQAQELAPAQIEETINDIMGNTDHAYWNENHPGHQRALDKMIDLRRKLAG